MPKPCRYRNDGRNQRKQKTTLSKNTAVELSALVVCVIHHLGLSRGSPMQRHRSRECSRPTSYANEKRFCCGAELFEAKDDFVFNLISWKIFLVMKLFKLYMPPCFTV
ncbi:hypothetical protein CDAR_61741 [Caerostris darwini]|uniref:Uncharacterized protein n=1 Tax=Caerostris darwini TaxID=1538125 RepID=A0AAV4VK65_9ARAC|nr:hypothetical protein CDAR_61741 [Caerostris darwini]